MNLTANSFDPSPKPSAPQPGHAKDQITSPTKALHVVYALRC